MKEKIYRELQDLDRKLMRGTVAGAIAVLTAIGGTLSYGHAASAVSEIEKSFERGEMHYQEMIDLKEQKSRNLSYSGLAGILGVLGFGYCNVRRMIDGSRFITRRNQLSGEEFSYYLAELSPMTTSKWFGR